MSLSGRVCLVTGASRGIGKGCARALADLGAKVYLTGRNQELGNTIGNFHTDLCMDLKPTF